MSLIAQNKMAKRYANGIYFNQPHPNAPEFVIGSLSINKQKFLEWLEREKANDKGYIKLDVLNGREDEPYITVNEYGKNEA